MDFGNLGSMSGRASMRRKQSNSLLQALGKSSRQSAIPVPHPHPHSQSTSTSAPPSAYSTPQSSTAATFADTDSNLYSPSPDDSASIISRSYHGHGHGHGGGGRSVSASSASMSTTTTAAAAARAGEKDKGGVVLRRPEDVYRLVRERMLSWSYLMEWYQGDVHWLNTVRIPRTLVESSIGLAKLDSRSRHFYTLGISLSALFDIPSAGDFLRALLKLLDDWESYADAGNKGVKNLFRGQRSGRKGTGVVSDFAQSADGNESYLLNVNMPFTPDFFQVHSSTCSIIRDIYKKLLGIFLPSPSSSFPPPSSQIQYRNLSHPSTIIHSAPLDTPFHGGIGSLSTATSSTFPNITSPTSTLVGTGTEHPSSGYGYGPSTQAYDAFQALIAGELPSDRTLVGDGQKLSPQVVELFLKVDAKLKKHFSALLREGDALARRVLDEEVSSLLSSLVPGAKALRLDQTSSAGPGGGGGWSTGAGTIGPNFGGTVWENEELRDFDTV